MSLSKAKKKLKEYVRTKKSIAELQRFFKTGKGEYGEGDIFIGVSVPNNRLVAKEFHDLSITDLQKLLSSRIHEERLLALIIMANRCNKFKHDQKSIFDLYLKNFDRVNNWDLVDTSAQDIVGGYLYDKDKSILLEWAKSDHLWTRRISMIATFYFIKKGLFNWTLKIAKIQLNDEHDLMHKAVGWMLREVGKRDFATEDNFLKKHYKKMPRTMLRYAIEKFPEIKRLAFLKGTV